jgi:hypothetical protein
MLTAVLSSTGHYTRERASRVGGAGVETPWIGRLDLEIMRLDRITPIPIRWTDVSSSEDGVLNGVVKHIT